MSLQLRIFLAKSPEIAAMVPKRTQMCIGCIISKFGMQKQWELGKQFLKSFLRPVPPVAHAEALAKYFGCIL